MKLLGWMHRKFRQNNGVDPFKDFAIGHSCNCLSGRPSLHEQHYLPKRPSKDRQFRNSFAGLDEATATAPEEDEPFEGDELFHGLLTIGTLGFDPPVADHHRTSVETITEKDTDVTPDELKLINEELEKVLGMDVKDVKEAKEDATDVSSGRNSHVSTGTVGSGKPSVEAAAENVTAVCPLQGYLFGSPIELPEARVAKEHRTSLGELFQRSRMAEESNGNGGGRSVGGVGKFEREEKREGGEKSGVQLVKKMLKRRVSGTSSRGSGDSVSAETKLNKILHIFHRKVHPESSTAVKKSSKSKRYEIKSNIRCDGGGHSGDRPLPDHDTILLPERAIRKEVICHHKCRSNPPPFTLAGSYSNENREYWIKTDADYLVLEL